jgi:hypothetical protein
MTMNEHLPQGMTVTRGVRDGAPFLEVEIGGTTYSSRNDDDDTRRCMSQRPFHTLRMASRLLTGTANESGDGVFTDAAWMPRRGVEFQFGVHVAAFEFAPVSFETDPPEAVAARLAERVAAVRAWVADLRAANREDSFEVALAS